MQGAEVGRYYLALVARAEDVKALGLIAQVLDVRALRQEPTGLVLGVWCVVLGVECLVFGV